MASSRQSPRPSERGAGEPLQSFNTECLGKGVERPHTDLLMGSRGQLAFSVQAREPAWWASQHVGTGSPAVTLPFQEQAYGGTRPLPLLAGP